MQKHKILRIVIGIDLAFDSLEHMVFDHGIWTIDVDLSHAGYANMLTIGRPVLGFEPLEKVPLIEKPPLPLHRGGCMLSIE